MFSLVNAVCEAVPLLPLGQGPALLACRINMAEGTVSLSVAFQRFVLSPSVFAVSLPTNPSESQGIQEEH